MKKIIRLVASVILLNGCIALPSEFYEPTSKEISKHSYQCGSIGESGQARLKYNDLEIQVSVHSNELLITIVIPDSRNLKLSNSPFKYYVGLEENYIESGEQNFQFMPDYKSNEYKIIKSGQLMDGKTEKITPIIVWNRHYNLNFKYGDIKNKRVVIDFNEMEISGVKYDPNPIIFNYVKRTVLYSPNC